MIIRIHFGLINMKNFFQWLFTILIMIPITIYLIGKFIFFYIFIREPKEKNSNGNYLSHLDDEPWGD